MYNTIIIMVYAHALHAFVSVSHTSMVMLGEVSIGARRMVTVSTLLVVLPHATYIRHTQEETLYTAIANARCFNRTI